MLYDSVAEHAGTDLLRPDGPVAFGSIPDGCTLRFYEEADDERLLELLSAGFPRWPAIDIPVTPLDHLRWKLRSAPTATNYHVVADVGERLVGCRFFVLQRVRFGERTLAVRQGVDTAVHPDYRGRGLMTAMTYPMPERLREFDADFSVRSDEEALRNAVRYDERRNVYADVDVLRRDAAPPLPAADRDWTSRTVAGFDERSERFFHDATRPFWLAVERTPEYLNWRFADERSGGFTIRVAEHDGALVGYAAYCARGERGQIADVLALPGRTDVVASLLVEAIDDLRRAGVASIECWSTRDHPYRELLSDAGFTEKRRSMQFYCQPMRVADEVVAPFAGRDTAMHLMSGDTDLV